MENNRPENGKVWFITGASRGFGLEITKLLLEKGNKLDCMDEQCGYVKNKPTEEK